jgi:hypothetical protein
MNVSTIILLTVWTLIGAISYGCYRQTKKNTRNSRAERGANEASERTDTDADTTAYDPRASKRASARVGWFRNRRTNYGRLPRSKSQIPILAWRGASLVYRSGKFEFASSNGKPFGVDADAKCTSYTGNHKAPRAGCTCGFYAVVKPEDCVYGPLRLLVELSGVVVEHAYGYRASHQRVVEVQIGRCARCARRATHIWVRDRDTILCLCSFCTKWIRNGKVITFDKVEESLGVRVVSNQSLSI